MHLDRQIPLEAPGEFHGWAEGTLILLHGHLAVRAMEKKANSSFKPECQLVVMKESTVHFLGGKLSLLSSPYVELGVKGLHTVPMVRRCWSQLLSPEAAEMITNEVKARIQMLEKQHQACIRVF